MYLFGKIPPLSTVKYRLNKLKLKPAMVEKYITNICCAGFYGHLSLIQHSLNQRIVLIHCRRIGRFLLAQRSFSKR